MKQKNLGASTSHHPSVILVLFCLHMQNRAPFPWAASWAAPGRHPAIILVSLGDQLVGCLAGGLVGSASRYSGLGAEAM